MKSQELTVIYAVMTCLLMLVIVQLALLAVGVESFARGERATLYAATCGSGLAFIAATRIVRYIQK
jgi:hypothetical protein